MPKWTPYSELPRSAYWRQSVAAVSPAAFDPVISAPFRLSPIDKVVTAGSCFGQHIARYLRNQGFNYLTTEVAHPILPAEDAVKFNYGTFSTRYGNLYTARQLLQLLHRVYERFAPRDDIWIEDDGRLIDPFRPQIQPGGFASLREYQIDRQKHFAAVRRAFEELDVFVFTLGLTEAWRSREDGAVYPVCPGAAGGTFDPEKHEFHNFTVEETVSDMLEFIDGLREINPTARCIITVSPVPLIATAANRHVLTATTYSKSVLQVAAEQITHAREDVVYFPSYEIITGNYSRGRYFSDNLRDVTEEGVSHVMRVFFRHFAETETATTVSADVQGQTDTHSHEMTRLVEVNCDEVMLAEQFDIESREIAA